MIMKSDEIKGKRKKKEKKKKKGRKRKKKETFLLSFVQRGLHLVFIGQNAAPDTVFAANATFLPKT